ncbi:MAG: hypothetical protein V7641_2148 [Blastocatellia bacterium]
MQAQGIAALDSDLTLIERQRILAIAADKGLDATRTLHKSFRLTKIYTMLPLTRALLGPDRLAREISVFWKASPSVSHYFLEESIAFCDFLQARLGSGLRIKYLAEVIAYERANLELLRPRTGEFTPATQFIRFHHDPVTLFAQLMKGQRPRAIAARPCVLAGSLDQDGEVQWSISADAV